MDFERKQMDIREKACTIDALTCNCVSAGNYVIYSVVGVYPFGEDGGHALANQSTERSPCTTTQNSQHRFNDILQVTNTNFVTRG